MLGPSAFTWNDWKKVFLAKKLGFLKILSKSVTTVCFSGKPAFLESVYLHSEMLDVTKFGLVTGICFVNTMIFIKKHIVKLSNKTSCDF